MTKTVGAIAAPNTNSSKLPNRARLIVSGLEQAILQHKLPPGTKLSEDEVGEIYGVSRTIVRSALQSLAHSQLVTIEKNRGAFIASPSPREAHEVFEARGLIEPRIAYMATDRMTAGALEQLRDHIAQEHEALHAHDTGLALALSGRFHRSIAEIADHDVFTSFVDSLISRSSLIIALYWKRPDTACESHSHEALISAFEKKNASAAENIMRSHIVDLHSGLDLKQEQRPQISLADALAR